MVPKATEHAHATDRFAPKIAEFFMKLLALAAADAPSVGPLEVDAMDVQGKIAAELRYFDSDEQRRRFAEVCVPLRHYVEHWQYGDEDHVCTVIASDAKTQIVYCPTGFGPAFPWAVQRIGESDLGMDSEWHAYLYEAFVCSTMWPDGTPKGFMRMAPGERGA